MVLLAARLILCAVFSAAAAGKLADREGTRRALVAFGMPQRLAGATSLTLPLVELAVGFSLLPVATAWVAAVAALALMLVFLAVIGVNLWRGRAPECHCFGQFHSAPVGRSTVALNLVLGVIAIVIIWLGRDDSGFSTVSWLGGLTSLQRAAVGAGAAGLALLGVLIALTWQLLRQQGRLLMRLESLESLISDGTSTDISATEQNIAGLPIGTPAPVFALESLDGGIVTLEGLLSVAKPLFVLFTNPHCGPCEALLPEIADWQREHRSLTFALISEGAAADNRAKIAAHGPHTVLLQREREVAESYQAWGTPSAVVVRPDGTIGSWIAPGAEAIRELLADASGPSAGRAATAERRRNGQAASPFLSHFTRGEPAPPLKLPDIDGRVISLAALHGHRTLLLFWNPQCSFCQQMLPELENWDANRPVYAPELVLVSAGSAAENRAMKLRAPILLDPDFHTGTAYGAQGTPAAILLDEAGLIESEMVAGAEAVLILANAPPLQPSDLPPRASGTAWQRPASLKARRTKLRQPGI
jgi:thiol-disulfide isomerase/thioredoxin